MFAALIARACQRREQSDTSAIYQSIAEHAAREGVLIGVPEFTAQGHLPPGMFSSDLLTFQERFVWNARRKELFDGLLSLVGHLRACGGRCIILGGSFVTNKDEPGDFEGVYQADEMDSVSLARLEPALLAERPQDALALEARYGGALAPWYRHGFGGTGLLEYLQYDDRRGRRKGVVVIEL